MDFPIPRDAVPTDQKPKAEATNFTPQALKRAGFFCDDKKKPRQPWRGTGVRLLLVGAAPLPRLIPIAGAGDNRLARTSERQMLRVLFYGGAGFTL